MLKSLGPWVESQRIQMFIMGVIVLNAITLGLETWPAAVNTAGPVLAVLDKLALAVFALEIAIKLAYRRLDFFKSGWNIFDFIIVSIALLPATGPLSVLRALRILRALRLLSVVPAMRRVIDALIRAIPGMTSVVGIISLIFYVAAVLATNLFGASFPDWFGSIGAALYTLFQIMTLESWSMGIVRPVMELHPNAWMFFVPFILITSFAILNLFIGIIVDAMQSQHTHEEELIRESHDDLHNDIKALHDEVRALKSLLKEKA